MNLSPPYALDLVPKCQPPMPLPIPFHHPAGETKAPNPSVYGGSGLHVVGHCANTRGELTPKVTGSFHCLRGGYSHGRERFAPSCSGGG
jgi:hypothetical protein